MKKVKCEICGKEMTGRLNGSHLKRVHNITLEDYIKQFPNAYLGEYNHKTFKCGVCGEVINGGSAKLKHIKSHGFNNVDEYNLQHEQRLCKCGCGQLTEYSYISRKYIEYVKGHTRIRESKYKMDIDEYNLKHRPKYCKCGCGQLANYDWNNHKFYKYAKGHIVSWSKGLTKETNEIIKKRGESIKQTWANDDGTRKERMCAKYKKTNQKKYNVDNVMELQEFRDKIKQTKKERYNDEHYNNHEKCKQTWLDTYNVENVFQLEEIKEKSKQTNLKLYGVEHACQNEAIKEKTKQTFIKRFGVEYAMQNAEIREKAKQTNLKLYGVEHVMQNNEICSKQQKNAYSIKEYISPSGNILKVQGYEPYALDILFEMFSESDITVDYGEMPDFFYTGSIDNNTHRYYPDIYITSINTFIEVKSPYTLQTDPEKLIDKYMSVVNSGYNMNIWVIDDKHNLIEII